MLADIPTWDGKLFKSMFVTHEGRRFHWSTVCLETQGHPQWPGTPLLAGRMGQRQLPAPTHVASAQMFLWPQKGRRTVAKALPWLNISVTWEGK